MRLASVFLIAVLFGMAIGGAFGRHGTSAPEMVAKSQDRPALDGSSGALVRAE